MASLAEALEKAAVKLYRKRMSRRLYEASDGRVKYGPFAGMALGALSHLSQGPLALKLFGLYEREVVEVLTGLSGVETLVNCGAGDGYFSIGLVRAGVVMRSICFELDEKGRKVIAENAARNGVADRITILGAADRSLPAVLAREGVDPARTVVLCDIEGAEFSVLSAQLIAALAQSLFVVELHTFAVDRGEQALADLEARFAPTHAVELISAKPRDWSGIPELEALPDNARALVASEGRKILGLWLVARPKGAQNV